MTKYIDEQGRIHREEVTMIEVKNEHCELCGKESNGAVFCSEECARCFGCEHQSGAACWYRVNMGTRAGHAWIGRIKNCPKGKVEVND